MRLTSESDPSKPKKIAASKAEAEKHYGPSKHDKKKELKDAGNDAAPGAGSGMMLTLGSGAGGGFW